VVEAFGLMICTVQLVVPFSVTVVGVNALVAVAGAALPGTEQHGACLVAVALGARRSRRHGEAAAAAGGEARPGERDLDRAAVEKRRDVRRWGCRERAAAQRTPVFLRLPDRGWRPCEGLARGC
jgi:hypothetical protein